MSISATLPCVALLDVQAVDQAEVDDVDPEFGVDDVAHRLLEVGEQLVVRCTAVVAHSGVSSVDLQSLTHWPAPARP